MSTPAAGTRHRVVITGSGFGGLTAAKALKRADVDVTLVSKSRPGCPPRFTQFDGVCKCPAQRPFGFRCVRGVSRRICSSWHTLGTTGVWSSGVRSRLRGGLAFSLPGLTAAAVTGVTAAAASVVTTGSAVSHPG